MKGGRTYGILRWRVGVLDCSPWDRDLVAHFGDQDGEVVAEHTVIVVRKGGRGRDGWRGAMCNDMGWEEAVILGF